MIRAYVEPSGEALLLARAEIAGALDALGGRLVEGPTAPLAGLVEVEAPDSAALGWLGGRLALARRVLEPVVPTNDLRAAARGVAGSGRSGAFRRVGRPSGPADALVRSAGAAYVDGGGTIELDRPEDRFWIADSDGTPPVLLREVATVDRRSYAARAMPRLPFRRPVSLPPRLARAAANLAAIRPGDRVLDPFLGTGALLAEAALLGARVYGIDRDPAMVRGALANFAYLGVEAGLLAQGDAREVDLDAGELRFDAIVTDPPYGRSSAAGGVDPGALSRAVLARWQGSVVPGGRVVVVAPGGPPTLDAPWQEELRLPVRVHRSLTREFRRYRRPA